MPHPEAADVGGGHEASEVTDHPATHRNDLSFAVDRRFGEGLPQPHRFAGRLRTFAAGHRKRERLDPGGFQAAANTATVAPGNCRISDDHRPGASRSFEGRTHLSEHALANSNGVGAIGSGIASQFHADRLRRHDPTLTRSRSSAVTVITRANPVCCRT